VQLLSIFLLKFLSAIPTDGGKRLALETSAGKCEKKDTILSLFSSMNKKKKV